MSVDGLLLYKVVKKWEKGRKLTNNCLCNFEHMHY